MNSWPSEGLVNGRILLRTWRLDDLRSWVALASDAEVRRWSPPMPAVTDEVARQRLEKSNEPDAITQPRQWAIADPADTRVLGSIDIRRDLPAIFPIADLGYNVHPDERGRGVASTAIRLLSQWLFAPDGYDLRRVQLDHAVENVPSCKAAQRAGYTVEGRRNGFLPIPDGDGVRYADVCLHGLVRAVRD